MAEIQECDRCNSKMATSQHRRTRKQEFVRKMEGGEYESQGVSLCSMCLDELWEFVFETEIDRSDKADPIPLEKLGESVERHIEDLSGMLEDLEAAKE